MLKNHIHNESSTVMETFLRDTRSCPNWVSFPDLSGCLDDDSTNDVWTPWKKIKPHWHVCHLHAVKPSLKEGGEVLWIEDVILKHFFPKKEEIETQFLDKNDDVILYDDFSTNKDSHYVRIPGKFAHDVFLAHVRGHINFHVDSLSMTRIDLKLLVPECECRWFDLEKRKFWGFHEKQGFERVTRNDEDVLGYIGNRKKRRMVRTYGSAKRKNKTFEVECQRDSAKRDSPFLLTRHFCEFHKIFVWELLEVFRDIKRTAYTDPLLDWMENYVKILHQKHVPGETGYQRKKKVFKEAKREWTMISGVDTSWEKPQSVSVRSLISKKKTKHSTLRYDPIQKTSTRKRVLISWSCVFEVL